MPYAYHGNLDDVGLGALDGSVDGVALGKASHSVVARFYVGQIPAPAKHSLGVAFLPCALLGLLHVLIHLGEGLEVVVDELLCLLVADVHPLRQSESGDAVNDAEVGLLSLLALCVAYVFDGLFPNLRRRGAVYVETLAECLDHVLVAREVRHYAKLDL